MLLEKVSGAVQPRSVTHTVTPQHSQGLQTEPLSLWKGFICKRLLFQWHCLCSFSEFRGFLFPLIGHSCAILKHRALGMQHLRLLPGPWRRIWERFSGGQALADSPAPMAPPAQAALGGAENVALSRTGSHWWPWKGGNSGCEWLWC